MKFYKEINLLNLFTNIKQMKPNFKSVLPTFMPLIF